MHGEQEASAPRDVTDPASAGQRSDAEPRLLGLSLAQYAAIEVGVAEGFELSDVLKIEGVESAGYPRARDAWADRIDEASDDAALGLDDKLDARRARARERYGRRIEPLDGDLGSFLGFIRAWSTAEDPSKYLADRAMRATDVLRLQARWLGAIGRDPALQTRAEEALRADINADLTVRVGESLLPEPEVPPSEFLDLEPPPVGVDDPAVDDDELGETDFTIDEPIFQPFAALFAAAPPAAGPSPPEPAPPLDVALRAPPEVAPSAPAEAQARRPELPSFLIAPKISEKLPELAATSAEVISPFFNKVLPFAKDEAPAPKPAVKPDPLARTSADWSAPQAPVLPFADKPKAPPEPPAASAPADLGATSMVTVSPFFNKVLPFAKDEAPAPKPAQKHDPLAHTSADWTAPKGPILPFAGKPVAAAPQAPSPPAAPPSPGPAPPSGPKAPPRAPELTLAQYASLCAELSVFPQQTEQVFQRHGLTLPPQRIHVDLVWRERLKRNPEAYREWQALYQHYRVYWAERARPSGGR